jgi:hypothetical protein
MTIASLASREGGAAARLSLGYESFMRGSKVSSGSVYATLLGPSLSPPGSVPCWFRYVL